MIVLEQINNPSPSAAVRQFNLTELFSISLHASLWICMLLKYLYPAKITVLRVDSTKESHPRLFLPK